MKNAKWFDKHWDAIARICANIFTKRIAIRDRRIKELQQQVKWLRAAPVIDYWACGDCEKLNPPSQRACLQCGSHIAFGDKRVAGNEPKVQAKSSIGMPPTWKIKQGDSTGRIVVEYADGTIGFYERTG